MRLIECYIDNFGVISKQKFSFNKGFNCFYADNGTGKTTLSVFIKAMLFGMGDGRRTGLLENERKRYTPWSGGAMGGSLSFSVDGREYRIERSFGKKHSEDTFKLYDRSTGLPSEDFPECVGEAVFGIDEAGFERTVFISERSLPIEKDNDKLSAKLSDLAGVDADLGSFEEAMDRLDERRKFLSKKGGKGRIFELRTLISECEGMKDTAERAEARATALTRQREEKAALLSEYGKAHERLLSEEKSALTKKGEELNRERSRKISEELSVLREKSRLLLDFFGGSVPTEEELSELQRLDLRLEELAKADEGDSLRDEFESLSALQEKNERKPSGRKSRTFGASFLILGAAFLPLGIFISPVFFALVAILGVAGIALLLSGARRPINKNSLTARLSELSERILCQQRERCSERSRLILEREQRLLRFSLSEGEGVKRIRQALLEYKETLARVGETERFLASFATPRDEFSAPVRNHAQISADIEDLEAKRRTLESEIALIGHSIAEARREAELAEEGASSYSELCEEYSEALTELSTLQSTMEYLERAKASLTAKYIGKTKAAFIKYTSLISEDTPPPSIDTEFSLSVSEGGITRPTEAYSRGTRELYSIAARLALSDSLYEGNLPFIILDDPFVYLDDTRKDRALDLLVKIAKERQVIYFTCSDSRRA